MAANKFGILKRTCILKREDAGMTDKVGRSAYAPQYEVCEVFTGPGAEAEALHAIDTRYHSVVSVINEDSLVLTEYWESAEIEGYSGVDSKIWVYDKVSRLEPLYQALYDFKPSLWACHDLIVKRGIKPVIMATGEYRNGIRMTKEEGKDFLGMSYLKYNEGDKDCFYIVQGNGCLIKCEYCTETGDYTDRTFEYYK